MIAIIFLHLACGVSDVHFCRDTSFAFHKSITFFRFVKRARKIVSVTGTDLRTGEKLFSAFSLADPIKRKEKEIINR